MTYRHLRHSRLSQASAIIGSIIVRASSRPPANHINGIENFWNQAKRHLRKYNGIPRHHFHLFLKECEWRFNYGPPAKLFSTLKSWIGRSNR